MFLWPPRSFVIKQAISMPVTITAVSLAPGECGFTFSPLPLTGRERTWHATLRTSGKVLHRRSGFAKPLFKPLGWPCKVPPSGSFHLGTRCTRKMLRTFRRHQMGPTWGTLTSLMSLPTEQATFLYPTRLQGSWGAGPRGRLGFLPCEGRAGTGSRLCTFPPASRDPGRPGKFLQSDNRSQASHFPTAPLWHLFRSWFVLEGKLKKEGDKWAAFKIRNTHPKAGGSGPCFCEVTATLSRFH